MNGFWRERLRADLPASLVVVLVALPLSLGIAVASGAPVIAGLISAVVGGIVAGVLGGSVVQVSGPAAGLTLIVAQTVATFGWRGACAITVAAGLLQLLLGASRVARAALAVSPAVVHGMLAGVGVVIVLSQIHVLLGDAPQASPLANLRALPRELMHNHTTAVLIGVLTLAVLALWRYVPALPRWIPAPLAAVVIGTVTAAATGWPVQRVEIPDDVLSFEAGPQWPTGPLHLALAAVGAVAMVASVESLLCAVAVDRMHAGPRVNLDRELCGQGAANLVAGALGGLPVAGVIVRSSTNVRAGARSRLSTVLHGVWILALVVAAVPVIELIPLPALAALLVYTGVQMVNLTHAQQVHQHRETPVYLLTLLSVVVLGLFEGVLVGMGCALLLSVWRLTHATVRAYLDGQGWHVVVEGSVTFLAVPRLSRELAQVPAGTAVSVELNADFMDHAAVTALHDWLVGHERGGGTVEVHELHHDWYAGAITGQRPPARKPHPAAWWLPRIHRPAGAAPAAPDASMPDGVSHGGGARERLARGARMFHRHAARRIAPLLADLARTGQQPTQLFITCSDSRLVPSLITATGPGDLFVVRNVGNLVPDSGDGDAAGVGAAVDFALNVLEVRTITVCGHSGCGALAALLRPVTHPAPMPHLGRWLRHAEPSLARVEAAAPSDVDHLTRLCQTNVVQQLEHLMSYPAVRERVAAGRLELVGMYFDLATSRVHLLGADQAFVPVEALSRS
ncbi:carbonic anhydrase [Catellatospora sp. TT07R-123]|uniref:bifunctional SulP family inorganic anion transporter/carbonic anhydrase n=1 Tax=Catellatospora sp. TT07R-123 TaxID=2733863 RepID=UPI001AFF9331|nr:SulP family inorganic anion transporter [Catellatospora sp. TT07R-123]GHJ48116.1 carbonic anhydrase [Catellatospora sp. TT07R-123]